MRFRREESYVFFLTLSALFIFEDVHALSGLTDFTFLLEPSSLVVSRGDSAVFHCSIQSDSSSPSVTWTKDGQTLKLDDRKLMWPNGSLHITDVQSSDRGQYQCQSSLPNVGTIISRTASLQTAYLSRNFLIQPEDLNIYIQDLAMFQCRGDGLPMPNVTWYKDSNLLKDVESNVRIYPDGVLEINPVKFADFGTYYCQVENMERVRSSRIAKLVQNGNTDSLEEGMVPSFVITPRDTKIPEGSSTILFCGANGRDQQGKQPVITWIKDGTTIDFMLTQGRLQVTGAGNLQIFNVQKSDAGTYSCRPSNMEDSIDSEASLSVLVPPKFLVKPQSRAVYEKTDVVLRCEIDGLPKPKIHWTKDGNPVSTSNYVIEDGNELRILGLVRADAGFYQCHGRNELGSIQTIAQLMVLNNGPGFSLDGYKILDPYSRNQANLPAEPSGLSAAIVSKRFITLRWNQPKDRRITGYSVFWKERSSLRERMLNTTHTEANIQRLKPDTSYEFRVRAINSYGFSQNFASIIVRTDKDVAVPSPAVNVRAMPLSPQSIIVSWDPPRQPKGRIIKYLLLFSEADSPQSSQIEVTSTQKLLTGLMAFREYTFHVVAVNGNGEGMSTREVSAKTFSDKPSEAPQNATLETASSTSLIVRWDPPPLDHQNGIITGYKIRYKMRGASRNGATVTTDGNRRLYALTNLEKDSEYQVRISALTVNGSGPLTPKLKATTYKDDLDESRVPDAPRKVRVTPHATSIRVSWSTPPPESKILVREYVLGWGKGVPDTESKIVGPDTQVFTIENLLPSSEYVITVKAKNNKGEGLPRYTTATTTKESVDESFTPMMPPVGLKTHVLSSSTIVLTWTDTSLGVNQMIQDNRYYTVRYRVASNMESENSRFWYLNSTDLNAHIDSLRPNTRYEFDVKVIKGRRQSPWSMKEINTTQEAAPGSSPLDLTPVPKENDPRAVIMNWQPPAKPNGQITGYLVFYTTDAKQNLREWVVDGVLEGDELSATIKRLTPSTTYYFKVQARNSKGYGPLSETVIYKTPKADGSGGGQIDPDYPPVGVGDDKIPPHDIIPQSPKPEDDRNSDGRRGGNSEGGLPTGIMNIIIASVVGATFCIVIIVVAVVCCRRRESEQRLKRQAQQNQQSPLKGKGQGRDLKPPDLWIHDNMEMKNIDKGQRSESTLTMSTTRRSSNDYRSMDDLPPYHDERNEMYYHPPSDHEERERFLPPRQPGPGIIRPKATKPLMIPVDAQPPPREPIAMVTALPNGALDRGEPGILSRPGFPRTQYNMQYQSGGPRVNAGDLPQPPPIQAFPVEYACQKSPDCHSLCQGQPMAVIAPGQHEFEGHRSLPRGNRPIRSFTSPNPLNHPKPLSGVHHHSNPKHQIVKPQQSPYKKAGPPLSAVPVKPRAIPVIKPKAPDVVLKAGADPDIQKSESTEELSAEMANLDCLMKDLNAITQQNFEV
ncbi:neogenin-like isoform X3 [Ostrea edulis]|uniref:neogenin-like isoform X3 n=1 Tax=Ostrea edulis TaxID=37623 RepID=UPI0024AFDBC8|nr:neogenin-like isoform X3 [Ostrea edulis]